jgi:hypothetical protein
MKSMLNIFKKANKEWLSKDPFRESAAPWPGRCSSTQTHRWVLQTAQSPIYYKQFFVSSGCHSVLSTGNVK